MHARDAQHVDQLNARASLAAGLFGGEDACCDAIGERTETALVTTPTTTVAGLAADDSHDLRGLFDIFRLAADDQLVGHLHQVDLAIGEQLANQVLEQEVLLLQTLPSDRVWRDLYEVRHRCAITIAEPERDMRRASPFTNQRHFARRELDHLHRPRINHRRPINIRLRPQQQAPPHIHFQLSRLRDDFEVAAKLHLVLLRRLHLHHIERGRGGRLSARRSSGWALLGATGWRRWFESANKLRLLRHRRGALAGAARRRQVDLGQA